jgi:hypothetical protein
MRGAWLRLRGFLGVGGTVFFLGLVFVLMWALTTDQEAWLLQNGSMVLWIPIIVVLGSVGASHYRRAGTTPTDEETLPHLLESRESYCLVLRSFGADGEVVLRRGYFGLMGVVRPNSTLEQIIGQTARKTLSLPTYGIVDQSVRFAPPGIAFMRVPDDRWQSVALTLIQGARTIFLIIGNEREIRRGFSWEIRQIAASGMSPQVVIALPPPPTGKNPLHNARSNAHMVLRLLSGSPGEGSNNGDGPSTLAATALIVRISQFSGIRQWTAATKSGRPSAILTAKFFARALREALLEQEEEERFEPG